MMRLPPFDYLAPRTVADALKYAHDHGSDAMFVAGGTDLYPNMKRRQFEPKVLVGLRGLAGLSGVSANGGLRLGALTTLAEVAEHPAILSRWPAVARAAGLVSSPPLRNAGTIGGIEDADAARHPAPSPMIAWERAHRADRRSAPAATGSRSTRSAPAGNPARSCRNWNSRLSCPAWIPA